MLRDAHKAQTELETTAKLAKSNLQMALANNEMLEDALRRESAASKNVGWRRRNDSQPDQPPPTSESSSRPSSRHGSVSASNSVHSTPTSEALPTILPSQPSSPVTKPATSPQPQPVPETGRFFRFRFGSSSASTSPNPATATAGSSSRPQTPPASSGSLSAPRRPLDLIRERDAAHLTSASLPSLVADTSKREQELEAELEAERAKFAKVNVEKQTLEAEVEGLSQALFEEANKMVAQERIKCAEIEEELRQVRQEKEALKSAMRIIEEENEKLKSPMSSAPESTVATMSVAEEGEPTPHGSRPATPRGREPDDRRSSKSRSSTDTEEIFTNSPSSSTRAIRERSTSPVPSASAASPLPEVSSINDRSETRNASPPLPDSPAVDTDEDEANEVDGWRSSGEASVSKSPFLDMPSAESPWSKI